MITRVILRKEGKVLSLSSRTNTIRYGAALALWGCRRKVSTRVIETQIPVLRAFGLRSSARVHSVVYVC